jgi:type IV pilus assembly protein PilC
LKFNQRYNYWKKMTIYRWEGINRNGKIVKGIEKALSESDLKETLLIEGIALLKGRALGKKAPIFPFFQRHITKTHLLEFFDELALLVSNGVDLIKSLEIVAQTCSSLRLASVAKTLSKSILDGSSLHAALALHPRMFSPSYIQLVGTGEKTGTLGLILNYIVEDLKLRCKLNDQLKQALLQPLITLSTAIVLLWGILVFILPHFQTLYQSMGSTLPRLTANTLALSNFLCSTLGFITIFTIIGFFIAFFRIVQRPFFKPLRDNLLINIPLVARIIVTVEQIHCLQTVNLFLSSGLPLTQALQQAESVAQNHVFKLTLQRAIQSITQGSSFSQALNNSNNPFFRKTVIALIEIGEQTGMLSIVLDKAQASLHQDLILKLSLISNLFSPLLMIFMGFVIGGLLVIIYLPIFSLGNLWKL